MQIQFPSELLNRIYRYIKVNDGQNILYKDIMEEFNITYPTVRKYIKWLAKRELITINGKRISITNDI